MELTIGQAGIFSLLGMLVIFFALFLLMCLIKVIAWVFKKSENKAPGQSVSEEVSVSVNDEPAPGSAGELKLYNTDPRDAAMIMAIVADELETPLNQLRFKSIREVK